MNRILPFVLYFVAGLSLPLQSLSYRVFTPHSIVGAPFCIDGLYVESGNTSMFLQSNGAKFCPIMPDSSIMYKNDFWAVFGGVTSDCVRRECKSDKHGEIEFAAGTISEYAGAATLLSDHVAIAAAVACMQSHRKVSGDGSYNFSDTSAGVGGVFGLEFANDGEWAISLIYNTGMNMEFSCRRDDEVPVFSLRGKKYICKRLSVYVDAGLFMNEWCKRESMENKENLDYKTAYSIETGFACRASIKWEFGGSLFYYYGGQSSDCQDNIAPELHIASGKVDTRYRLCDNILLSGKLACAVFFDGSYSDDDLNGYIEQFSFSVLYKPL